MATGSSAPSTVADSDLDASELPLSDAGDTEGATTPLPAAKPLFPPYPPYATTPAPASLKDAIYAGREIRVQHKSVTRKSMRPTPKPAKPKGPKATDVKCGVREARAHARCLRRHGAVLTDRLERMAKPQRRTIIYLWREHADTLPEDTINRLRNMLDADEPFKPDQAYEYFVNLRKTKKKAAQMRGVNQVKKDLLAVCADKRFVWARNATVAFARGIQHRLRKPGRYALADAMLRLSDIIMDEMCSYMNIRKPSRRCTHPKARFMMEMADKVAIWIDEILAESDDRMLMMDFDEDDEVQASMEGGDDGDFTDDFLNMMGGVGRQRGPKPAYQNFTGESLDAFNILTDAMYKKGNEPLVKHGKYEQNYTEAANCLRETPDFNATNYDYGVAKQLNQKLKDVATPNTPATMKRHMDGVVDICANFLAQNAEFNKDKGKAFQLLTKSMRSKPNELVYSKGPLKKTNAQAAKELEEAKGLESSHDDPNLSQQIHSNLKTLVDPVTPTDMKQEMAVTLDASSKYLSQKAIDDSERGPAFDLLISELEKDAGNDFTPEYRHFASKHAAAYTLTTAPGLSADNPDPATLPRFAGALHATVDSATPTAMKSQMNVVVDRCAKYLSQFNRDRDKVLDILLKTMKASPDKELCKRLSYSLKYGAAAAEIEAAPTLVSFKPVKDIADEIKTKLSADVQPVTPADLAAAMKTTVNDASKLLSQDVALKSGVAGEKYAMDLLVAIKKSLGKRPLYKYKAYGQTYADAAHVLKHAGALLHDPKSDPLRHDIRKEMNRGVSERGSPNIAAHLNETMEVASKHLATVGHGKGEALDHLVTTMKEKGDEPLAELQGFPQSYAFAAERIENAPSLANDDVHQPSYKKVQGKLAELVVKKPPPAEHDKIMPHVVEEAATFLASGPPKSGRAAPDVFKELTPEELAKLTPEERAKYEAEKKRHEERQRIEAGKGVTFKELTPEELAKLTPEERAKYEAEKKRHKERMEAEKAGTFKELTPEELAKLSPEERAKYEADKKRHKERMEAEKAGTFKELTPEELAKLTPEERAKYEAEKKNHEERRRMEAEKGGTFRELTPEELAKLTPEERAKYEAEKKRHEERQRMDAGKGGAFKELSPEELAKLTPEERAKYEAEKKRHEERQRMEAGKGGAFKELTSEELAKLTPEERAKYEAEKKRHEERQRMEAGKGGAFKELTPEELAKLTPEERAKYEAEKKREEERRRLEAGKGGTFKELTPAELAKLTPEERAKYEAEKKRHEERRRLEAGKEGAFKELTPAELAKLTPEERAKYEAEKKRHEERRRMEAGKGGTFRELSPEELAKLTPEERAKYEAEKRQHLAAGELGGDRHAVMDAEHAEAHKILHKQLRARGGEVFYRQPQTVLTHAQASEWLSAGPRVQRTVKASSDTGRLANKFEKKLGALVSNVTPPVLQDAMQDVIIESSQRLSECFVSKNFKALAQEALISEMQKKCNEILIELDGAAETYFFAAQRLKKTDKLEPKEVCTQSAYHLTKELNEMMRCRVMARKLTSSVKEHVKEVADYLSGLVTKPDEKIEAYVALLGEMEAAGDANLIEGNITKSFKDAAAYLRQLTSYSDRIGRGDSALQSSIEGKLKGVVTNVAASGYSPTAMSSVITESTRLLVSYIKFQGEKTDALQALIEQMDQAGDTALLRHGNVRKSYTDAANLLKGKNTDQLGVKAVDPVVTRKIQIKLANLMQGKTPDKFQALMDEVVMDATVYLAVALLQPQVIKVCKCMKNAFVQCELWCEEILRRVGRPCCACPRHALASPGSSRAEVALRECPTRARQRARAAGPCADCPAPPPPAAYMLYATRRDQRHAPPAQHRHPSQTLSDSLWTSFSRSQLSNSPSPFTTHLRRFDEHELRTPEKYVSNRSRTDMQDASSASSSQSFHTPVSSNSSTDLNAKPYWQTHTTMYSSLYRDDTYFDEPQRAPDEARPLRAPDAPPAHSAANVSLAANKNDSGPRNACSLTDQGKSAYNSRAPIVSTDEMADWHAMMVSLIWNVQAWRDWIKENIDKALSYQHNAETSEAEGNEMWDKFQKRVTVEALQWRQYNTFSKQLTQRLVQRYKDKKIMSPTRTTVKTDTYNKCQQEMLKIIEMFNRWTHWLMVVVKETDSLKQSSRVDIPLHELRWNHYKKKIATNAKDWARYELHLKVCWEDKYRVLLSEWLPAWRWSGPVWVVSACGAVPSGAVAAGALDGELIWVARTTHKCDVLPAALVPSKHCCLVYADGAVHHYNKYQVMCNAEVRWVTWRAGEVGARAVRVAAGVHVGRVLYRGSHLVGAVRAPLHRCHVIIFGRQFAFSCYELLVLAGPASTPHSTDTHYSTAAPYSTIAPYSTTAPYSTAAPYSTTTPYSTTAPYSTAAPYSTTAPYSTAAPYSTTAPYSTAAPYSNTTPYSSATPDPEL